MQGIKMPNIRTIDKALVDGLFEMKGGYRMWHCARRLVYAKKQCEAALWLRSPLWREV
jgi:hypothetical protein